jgi:hypothetical protein
VSKGLTLATQLSTATHAEQSQEEFEDTKGVIRIRKLKKDGQNITQKTKD